MSDPDRDIRDLIASQAELVGSITHDLKGLLSGVEGGIYLVSSGLQKNKQDRVEQGTAMMKRSLGRIRRIVASSLYYVKDRAIDWQPIALPAVSAEVAKALDGQPEHLGVALVVKAQEGVLQGDPFAVHSVVSNLVEYALEACQVAKMRPDPTVTLAARQEGEYATFEVTARGFVMSEETRGRVLAAHYAPSGVDRSHLPLFIAHRLIRRHGGHLTIEISGQAGTTVFRAAFRIERPTGDPASGPTGVQDQLAAEWEK